LPLTSSRARAGAHTRAPLRLSWRVMTISVLLVIYAVLTALIVVPNTFVLQFDTYCVNLHLWSQHPAWHPWLYYYVMVGQRGPATLVFLPFFIWVAWREGSFRPLVVLGTALVWLNITVGVVKYAIGRIGPLGNDNVHQLFVLGGNIYPSGHVSNTVVLYGAVAWIAPRYRRTLVAAAVFLSVSVGLCTIYLRTHWFSDVVGGWIAGALVLLTLPYLLPFTQRWTDRAFDWARGWWLRRYPRARVAAPSARSEIPSHATPVSADASSHNLLAAASSRDAFDDPAR
jgi:membrane-associated phospholipid phosphatase